MQLKTTRVLASGALAVGLVVAMLPSVSSASTRTVSDSTFNTKFSTMALLKPVAAKGHGLIGVILPDEVTSARYTQFDAPYLKKAFLAAGLTKRQFIIQNALGSDTTEFTDAQADIAKGARVLLVDPLDSTAGAAIEGYAKARGVKVIDYDRLTLGGIRSYYVSFNNVTVGTLIGKGMMSCLTAWKVTNPDIAIMYGAPTDNNATLFASGYNAVLSKAGYTVTAGSSTQTGAFKSVSVEPGTWTPGTAQTEFQQALSANHGVNAALMPNDANAAAVITYLQSQGVKAQTFPTTGQDAQTTGLQDIISGYQCGTVYKPIWLEAQAAAALAVYLRAGIKPPKGIVNSTTHDSVTSKNVPSALLSPVWVTASTLEATVIKDGQVTAKQLCTATAPVGVAGAPTYAADCATYGIH